jgi:FAD/FMN-containing dehydrogenase
MTPCALDREGTARLRSALGDDRVIDTGEALALVGQDIFNVGRPVAAIVRPRDTRDVQALVALARELRLILVPRGGGVSYTGGFLSADPGRTVVLDMRGMAAIREINARDMYAVVEPGCTWQSLEEHLRPHGLECPFRGPVSGRLATVGGGVAQNALFYGSSLFGTAADNVLGLEVVAGTGDVIRTGSHAVADGSPFLRHFGPDLTGLFTADCGAMGVKTAIVLKLRRAPAARDALCFIAADMAALFGFLEEIGHDANAAQTMALDVRLQEQRVRQTGWRERIGYARALLTGGGSAARRIAEGAAMVRAGLQPSPGRGMAVHVFVEGASVAECAGRVTAIAARARAFDLKPGNPAVSLAMIRTPFGPVTGLAGGPGERWVPVHFILPHSRALAGMAAIQAVVQDHDDAIARHGIKVRHLIANLGAGAVTLEPMFLWKDRLTPAAHATLIAQGGTADAGTPSRPEAEQAVAALRLAMIDRLDALGALHTQIGRHYPYLPRLAPGTAAMVGAMHAMLDPDGVMNPGVLGVGPAARAPGMSPPS